MYLQNKKFNFTVLLETEFEKGISSVLDALSIFYMPSLLLTLLSFNKTYK